ncbi:hypothetical protein [Formosa algae]|uniref:Uncharacterized protein n=1 Tax=Formosa algae TaxID=225843 RepID=A0A9X0YH58_9FLAO|nr:hypothetical protein [Formosa algae]MBP1838387.1 hypothetical protein [Formosa algae]MDQ0334522.1 hypothetical protein [Formosa algae]OEI79069.1 hypothetical protein AST99_16280 [Formosa algae]PNW30110.1 hypothetical protein BKP44_00120 [Formosa algae]
MTQHAPSVINQISDNILGLLSSYEDPEFKDIFKKTNPGKIDMDYIAKALQRKEWEKYSKDAIKDKLIRDGYITEHENGSLTITRFGLEFQKKGGYYLQDLNLNQTTQTETPFEKIKKKMDWQFILLGVALFVIQILSIDYIKDFFN